MCKTVLTVQKKTKRHVTLEGNQEKAMKMLTLQVKELHLAV